MAATTVSAMATINININMNMNMNTLSPKLPTPKHVPVPSKPPTLPIPKPLISPQLSTSAAMAGAVFSALGTCDAAFAAQQIATLAEGGDNRGLALLLPIIPAIAWVLFNILQPALNQLNRMRSTKGLIVGLGLGGLSGLASAPHAHAWASEVSMIAEGSADNRGQLLLFVVTPAIAWVLYNILQPALNQINRMRSQ
ncbi:hypothetical protein Fmac_004415 [Flemingia macrophylla]|uniref:Photosystem II core complex proteins psbY, chloroplastic n=1 Tax=Flemingia macrophylla TaxID=520843 RepID=A0ABD1N7I2_9FABA